MEIMFKYQGCMLKQILMVIFAYHFRMQVGI